MTKKLSLADKLRELNFARQNEADIITAAIKELSDGIYEGQVVSHLKTKFGRLALNQNISPEALKFYTILMKPNVGNDVGLSIGPWMI